MNAAIKDPATPSWGNSESVTHERQTTPSSKSRSIKKEAQKQVDKLVSDNTHLMAQLADAEKAIADFKADGAQKDATIADLKKDLGSVKQQLTDAKKESADYQNRMADMKAKLDATATDLTTAKADNTTVTADKKKMQDENELLRGIVMREMKEQARRDQTRKLVLDSMSKLNLKSDELLKKVDYLGQPVVKLTAKERALFKKPPVEVHENEISLAAPKADEPEHAATPPPGGPGPEKAATIASAKPPEPTPAAPPATTSTAPSPPCQLKRPLLHHRPLRRRFGQPNPPSPRSPPILQWRPPRPSRRRRRKTPSPRLSTCRRTLWSSIRIPPPHRRPWLFPELRRPSATRRRAPMNLPRKALNPGSGWGRATAAERAGGAPSGEVTAWMQQAKDEFERGNYRDSEKLYEKVLQQTPNNLSALDNLGVVRFRSSKIEGPS